MLAFRKLGGNTYLQRFENCATLCNFGKLRCVLEIGNRNFLVYEQSMLFDKDAQVFVLLHQVLFIPQNVLTLPVLKENPMFWHVFK